jgi:hypothetical protein
MNCFGLSLSDHDYCYVNCLNTLSSFVGVFYIVFTWFIFRVRGLHLFNKCEFIEIKMLQLYTVIAKLFILR